MTCDPWLRVSELGSMVCGFRRAWLWDAIDKAFINI